MDAYIASIKYKIQQDKIHYCFFRFSPMDAYIVSIKYKIQQDKVHYCFSDLAPWMHTSYQ